MGTAWSLSMSVYSKNAKPRGVFSPYQPLIICAISFFILPAARHVWQMHSTHWILFSFPIEPVYFTFVNDKIFTPKILVLNILVFGIKSICVLMQFCKLGEWGKIAFAHNRLCCLRLDNKPLGDTQQHVSLLLITSPQEQGNMRVPQLHSTLDRSVLNSHPSHFIISGTKRDENQRPFPHQHLQSQSILLATRRVQMIIGHTFVFFSNPILTVPEETSPALKKMTKLLLFFSKCFAQIKHHWSLENRVATILL